MLWYLPSSVYFFKYTNVIWHRLVLWKSSNIAIAAPFGESIGIAIAMHFPESIFIAVAIDFSNIANNSAANSA